MLYWYIIYPESICFCSLICKSIVMIFVVAFMFSLFIALWKLFSEQPICIKVSYFCRATLLHPLIYTHNVLDYALMKCNRELQKQKHFVSYVALFA